MTSWIVKDLALVKQIFNALVDGFVELRVATVSNTISVHYVRKVSRIEVLNLVYD